MKLFRWITRFVVERRKSLIGFVSLLERKSLKNQRIINEMAKTKDLDTKNTRRTKSESRRIIEIEILAQRSTTDD
jgi:hypothetical protein